MRAVLVVLAVVAFGDQAVAEEAPAVVDEVAVKLRAVPFGEYKGGQYPVVSFEVTSKAAAPQGSRPLVQATCASGGKVYEATGTAMEVALDRLGVGRTKATEVPLFVRKPFKGKPESCDVSIRVTKGVFDRDGTEVGRYCYRGGKVTPGSCS